MTGVVEHTQSWRCNIEERYWIGGSDTAVGRKRMKTDVEDSISRTAVLELIKELGGCDAGDEFARGWDAACDMFYKTITERF